MSSRTPQGRPTQISDIEAALRFASRFLDRARVLEAQAAEATRVYYEAGNDAGLPGSPMLDPTVADNMLLELFGFVAAIRTARDYISSAVARGPGKTTVRDVRLASDLIVFHKSLGNHTLHQGMIDAGRTFFLGGQNHGKFKYNYRHDSLAPDGQPAYDRIQAAYSIATGMQYGIVEMGDKVLAELNALHGECTANAWY